MSEQDKRIRDYYNNLSLPQDKLEQLLKLAPQGASQAEPYTLTPSVDHATSGQTGFSRFNPIYWRMHHWLPTAIACAFVLSISLWMHGSSSDSERMQRTVREVAMNHTTRLEPEYRGESLAMLDNSMQQLPFALVLPKKAIDNAYELVGSRYCSLGGVLAAHVRLKSAQSGKPVSLFVTSNADELKDIRSQKTTSEGIDVEFWREGGLFFALAQRS